MHVLLGILKWTAIVIVTLWLALVVFITFFSFNFMRGPLERMSKEKTGRELSIKGDLRLKWAWPVPHVVANQVTFAPTHPCSTPTW